MNTLMTKTNTPKMLALSVSMLALAACATVQPNSNIADAQTRLSAAYNDKETSDRGQGSLQNAKEALQSAETQWKNGEKEKSAHNLMLGETYIDIAETRGQQAKVEKQNVLVSNQAGMAAKNRQLASKDAVIAGQTEQLADKNKQLADAEAQLRASNMQVSELGSTMVLQDVAFDTGKSQLLPGGVNRLQPLINYLRLSPETQVRIEGYTDNVGGAAYNQQLSLDRANAVKAILSSGGVGAEWIQTVGSGLNKPVATNSTTAGRQSIRRVEVTLLKQPGL